MSYSRIKIYSFHLIILLLFISCKQPYSPSKNTVDKGEKSKKLIEMNRALIRKDRLTIKGYINRNHLDMQETGTGLWYSILKNGDGEKVIKGVRVNIDYTLSLLDGRKCYSSENEGVKAFIVGQGGVESGLEEGILLLHAGDKAKFILPPHLAHGLTGDGNKIPARSIIVYDVELISIQ